MTTAVTIYRLCVEGDVENSAHLDVDKTALLCLVTAEFVQQLLALQTDVYLQRCAEQ